MTAADDGDIPVDDGTSVWDIIKQEVQELRWYVLSVACFLTFGSYFIYDFPGSIGTGSGNTIEALFKSHGLAYTESMNQYLYSVYSWPNTVLSIVGGLLIDRFLGLRRAMLLFTALIFCGSVLFLVGIQRLSYPMLLSGRVIFGLGGESLAVAQSAFVARWFKGRRGMALAFGVTISFSRVGSSFNFLFSPTIALRWGVAAAALAGVGACLISVLACGVLVWVDGYAVRTGYIADEPQGGSGAVDGEDEEPPVKLSAAVRMPFLYWLLCAVCVFCYTAIFPFMGVGKNFFQVKYGYSGDRASKYLSSYQITSAIASPLIGLAVDSVGRSTWWLILASACFVLVHLLFMVTMIPGLLLMILMGVFYSFLVSGLWPSIPWAVPEKVVGVAYGLMTAIQNVGLAIFPMLVGAILDRYHGGVPQLVGLQNGLPPLTGYMWTEAVFLTSALLAFLASIAALVEDVRASGILTASSADRPRIIAELMRHRDDYEGVLPDLEDVESYFESEPANSIAGVLPSASAAAPTSKATQKVS